MATAWSEGRRQAQRIQRPCPGASLGTEAEKMGDLVTLGIRCCVCGTPHALFLILSSASSSSFSLSLFQLSPLLLPLCGSVCHDPRVRIVSGSV